jgi:hypothetical protein
MLRSMKSVFVCALALVACGPGSAVCPTGWSDDTSAPGKCAASSTFVSDTQTAIGSGVYGFMRTNAHGGSDQLVVGALVFAVASTNTTCDAPSVNPIAQTTTDQNGVFVLKLPPGDYRITSGEIQACTPVHVDANTLTDVPLTTP